MAAFFVSMEWSGQQQISFLIQSVFVGIGLGVLLDIMTSLVCDKRYKRCLWTDILFGPVAAVITFLGALVIMDGQLHPLLFMGIAFGMLAEHLTIGPALRLSIRFLRKCVGDFERFLCNCIRWMGRKVIAFCRCMRKMRKNKEKPRNLFGFFRKKT